MHRTKQWRANQQAKLYCRCRKHPSAKGYKVWITFIVVVNLRGIFNFELKLMPSYYLEMLLQNPMLWKSSYHLI